VRQLHHGVATPVSRKPDRSRQAHYAREADIDASGTSHPYTYQYCITGRSDFDNRHVLGSEERQPGPVSSATARMEIPPLVLPHDPSLSHIPQLNAGCSKPRPAHMHSPTEADHIPARQCRGRVLLVGAGQCGSGHAVGCIAIFQPPAAATLGRLARRRARGGAQDQICV
jgi:hypothetical protein